jgi:hypothetical protein
MCRPILNLNSARQPNFRVLSLTIVIPNEPSPSIKPDQTPGLIPLGAFFGGAP